MVSFLRLVFCNCYCEGYRRFGVDVYAVEFLVRSSLVFVVVVLGRVCVSL